MKDHFWTSFLLFPFSLLVLSTIPGFGRLLRTRVYSRHLDRPPVVALIRLKWQLRRHLRRQRTSHWWQLSRLVDPMAWSLAVPVCSKAPIVFPENHLDLLGGLMQSMTGDGCSHLGYPS